MAPRNAKSIEILTCGLRDEDPAVRKATVWGARQFLENLRRTCRGTNVGKLPIPRAVIEEFGKALQPFGTHARTIFFTLRGPRDTHGLQAMRNGSSP